MSTRVVNLRREACDIDITRRSLWGNPFYIGRNGTRAEVIAKYRQWIFTQPTLLANLHTLKGKRLGCVCKPLACHGDVLAELAESIVVGENSFGANTQDT
jgi:bacteriorhodopsin